MGSTQSFLARHEFIIRRLHSLCGLIPVGAYMCVHLLVNASVLDSAATYQNAVFNIHRLGALLPVVEWGFIFLPILFHAILGVVIIRGGLPNSGTYRYGSNIRYTLQRATGMIAFLFILWHVLHMHGWFHIDAWTENIAEPLGGHKFRPYNATSTAGSAMQASLIIPILYAIGVLASVFHLANGIWTMGITWGVWVTPRSQKWSLYVCSVFGIGLAVVGVAAIWGFGQVDVDDAHATEKEMLEFKIEAKEVKPNPEKVWQEEKEEVGEQPPADEISPESGGLQEQEVSSNDLSGESG